VRDYGGAVNEDIPRVRGNISADDVEGGGLAFEAEYSSAK
jgi:hypothetical protein